MLFFTLACGFLFLTGITTPKEEYPEYVVKSIWLYKICKYVTWDNAKENSDDFKIAVFGRLANGASLEIPGDKKLKGKSIKIYRTRDLNELKNAHVVYIAESQMFRLDDILKSVKGKAVLTVGDSEKFDGKGVILSFFIEQGNLKFYLSREAEKNSTLRLNPQLYEISADNN